MVYLQYNYAFFIGYEISKSIRNGRYPCTKDDDCLTAQKEEINKWNAVQKCKFK